MMQTGLRFMRGLSELRRGVRIALLFALVSYPSYAQRTFTVNDTADGVDVAPGDNICADERGLCTLRAAAMEARAVDFTTVDTIRLPAGVYRLTLEPIEGPFSPSSDGGDLYFGHSQPTDLLGAGRDETIIEQTVEDRVLGIGLGAVVNMSGVTIRGGRAVVREGPDHAAGYGGGISTAGTVILSNARVSLNEAELSGGGIANRGQLTLFNVEILDNQSTGGGGFGGGGMSVHGPLGMIRTEVSGNRAVTGGGLHIAGVRSEDIRIALSRITDNHAVGRVRSDGYVDQKGRGGGIHMFYLHWPWIESGPGIIEYTTISGNSATEGGGLHHYGFDPMTVKNSLIANNTAHSGGGVTHRAEATYENTTITGNVAQGGGAIEFRHNPVSHAGVIFVRNELTLLHATLADNEAGVGSGVFNNAPDKNIIRAGGTIFANLPAIENFGSAVPIISLDNNIDTGISTQAGAPNDRLSVDPLLLPLADNGGPTWTRGLAPSSPALDGYVGSCVAIDQRNAPRPFGARCDIGAFEDGATPEPLVILPAAWITRRIGTFAWYFSPRMRRDLSKHGFVLRPLYPPSKQSTIQQSRRLRNRFSLEVLGGSQTDAWAQLTLKGGVRFAHKSGSFTLRFFSFSTEQKDGVVYAALGHEGLQGDFTLAGALVLLAKKPTWTDGRLKARLVLTAGAAETLNHAMGVEMFKEGLDLGPVLAVFAPTQPKPKSNIKETQGH